MYVWMYVVVAKPLVSSHQPSLVYSLKTLRLSFSLSLFLATQVPRELYIGSVTEWIKDFSIDR